MKKVILLAIFMLYPLQSIGMYDFCESPSDYNMFPAAYDMRTEYWIDIPNYQTDCIKYENIKPDDKTLLKNITAPKQDKSDEKTNKK